MILNGTISVTTFGNCLYTSFFVRRSITPELVSCRCRSRVFTDTVADVLLRPVQYRCWKANSDGNMAGVYELHYIPDIGCAVCQWRTGQTDGVVGISFDGVTGFGAL